MFPAIELATTIYTLIIYTVSFIYLLVILSTTNLKVEIVTWTLQNYFLV